MPDGLAEKLKGALTEKVIYWIVAALGLLFAGAIDFGIIETPFYHGGWFIKYRAWLFIPIVVAIGSIVACRTTKGFAITSVIAIVAAVAFGLLYERRGYENDPWPFLPWVLHTIVLALLVGMLSYVAALLVRARRR